MWPFPALPVNQWSIRRDKNCANSRVGRSWSVVVCDDCIKCMYKWDISEVNKFRLHPALPSFTNSPKLPNGFWRYNTNCIGEGSPKELPFRRVLPRFFFPHRTPCAQIHIPVFIADPRWKSLWSTGSQRRAVCLSQGIQWSACFANQFLSKMSTLPHQPTVWRWFPNKNAVGPTFAGASFLRCAGRWLHCVVKA